jgi:hypothetical protein
MITRADRFSSHPRCGATDSQHGESPKALARMNDDDLPTTVPGGLLVELRKFHTRRPELLSGDLPGLRLTRIQTSSPNHTFVLQGRGQRADDVCLTLFTGTPELSGIDVLARRHLQTHLPDQAPRVLWHDHHNNLPAIVTANPGYTPLTEISPRRAWRAVLATFTALRHLPLGPVSDRPRACSAVDRVTDPYVRRLLRASHSPRRGIGVEISAGVAELLARWDHQSDIAILAQPTPRVLSPGTPDLTRWIWNPQGRTAVPIEWTEVGYSDVAWDAADLIEHPGTHLFSHADVRRDLTDLGVHTAEERIRFHAARRLLALHWLITLHSSQVPPHECADQYRRTKKLLSRPRVQETSW